MADVGTVPISAVSRCPDLASMDYQVSMNFNQERMVARRTMLFGFLALALASFGLYGITSYSVARTTADGGVTNGVASEVSEN